MSPALDTGITLSDVTSNPDNPPLFWDRLWHTVEGIGNLECKGMNTSS